MSKRNKNTATQNKPGRRILWLIIAVLAVAIGFLITIKQNDNPVKSLTPPASKTIFSAPEFQKHGTLTFFKNDGDKVVTIDIEIKDSGYEQADGMMRRDTMEELQGMLFIFADETERSFWMKNTILSLDLLFVNSRNEIVTIHKNAVPFDKSNYKSDAPAKYVVEVLSGFTDKYNIVVGDKIEWTKIESFGQ
ncbi:MAG: DUF192 domain-containing protein [candidate division Zixibacteria bacterium]